MKYWTDVVGIVNRLIFCHANWWSGPWPLPLPVDQSLMSMSSRDNGWHWVCQWVCHWVIDMPYRSKQWWSTERDTNGKTNIGPFEASLVHWICHWFIWCVIRSLSVTLRQYQVWSPLNERNCPFNERKTIHFMCHGLIDWRPPSITPINRSRRSECHVHSAGDSQTTNNHRDRWWSSNIILLYLISTQRSAAE